MAPLPRCQESSQKMPGAFFVLHFAHFGRFFRSSIIKIHFFHDGYNRKFRCMRRGFVLPGAVCTGRRQCGLSNSVASIVIYHKGGGASRFLIFMAHQNTQDHTGVTVTFWDKEPEKAGGRLVVVRHFALSLNFQILTLRQQRLYLLRRTVEIT